MFLDVSPWYVCHNTTADHSADCRHAHHDSELIMLDFIMLCLLLYEERYRKGKQEVFMCDLERFSWDLSII